MRLELTASRTVSTFALRSRKDNRADPLFTLSLNPCLDELLLFAIVMQKIDVSPSKFQSRPSYVKSQVQRNLKTNSKVVGKVNGI
jgi:hypothetical protein